MPWPLPLARPFARFPWLRAAPPGPGHLLRGPNGMASRERPRPVGLTRSANGAAAAAVHGGAAGRLASGRLPGPADAPDHEIDFKVDTLFRRSASVVIPDIRECPGGLAHVHVLDHAGPQREPPPTRPNRVALRKNHRRV